MRVAEGDTIGLTNGRYGKVSFLVTQNHFLVDLFPEDPDEPKAETPEQSWHKAADVASIV